MYADRVDMDSDRTNIGENTFQSLLSQPVSQATNLTPTKIRRVVGVLSGSLFELGAMHLAFEREKLAATLKLEQQKMDMKLKLHTEELKIRQAQHSETIQVRQTKLEMMLKNYKKGDGNNSNS